MRFKRVNGNRVQFSAAEETARDAEEAAWAAGAATRAAEAARIDSLKSAVKGDSLIQNLQSMTAAQFDNWWDANVTNANQAIGVLKKLMKLVILKLL